MAIVSPRSLKENPVTTATCAREVISALPEIAEELRSTANLVKRATVQVVPSIQAIVLSTPRVIRTRTKEGFQEITPVRQVKNPVHDRGSCITTVVGMQCAKGCLCLVKRFRRRLRRQRSLHERRSVRRRRMRRYGVHLQVVRIVQRKWLHHQ